MSIRIRETVALMEGATIKKSEDGKTGVIENVAVLHPTSKNRRRYSESARQDAVKVFEGARVNIDHKPDKPGETRVKDLAGSLHGLHVDEKGVVRAKEFRVRGPEAATAINLAETAADLCGLSINADGSGKIAKDGWTDIERITQSYSVDIVDRPGSTINLHESFTLFEGPIADKIAADKALKSIYEKTSAAWSLVYESLGNDELTTAERKARVVSVCNDLAKELGGDSGGTSESLSESQQETTDMDIKTLDMATLTKDRPDLVKSITESAVAEANKATDAARAEAATAKAQLTEHNRRVAAKTIVDAVLLEEKLSTVPQFNTSAFVESLVSAASGLEGDAAKAAIKRLIDDRKALISTNPVRESAAPIYPAREPLPQGNGTGNQPAWKDPKERDALYDSVVKESARALAC